AAAELAVVGDGEAGALGEAGREAGLDDGAVALERRALDREAVAAGEGQAGGRSRIAEGVAPAEAGARGERRQAVEAQAGGGAGAEGGIDEIAVLLLDLEGGRATLLGEAVGRGVHPREAGKRLQGG